MRENYRVKSIDRVSLSMYLYNLIIIYLESTVHSIDEGERIQRKRVIRYSEELLDSTVDYRNR